ncbi:MAG: hypothetical protein C5B47_08115 [Verrucomicrobia bacterium]|nr:MAG: hypothetical protein C5B47_08115 [Verrucomicrobiota bacterium]
MRTIIALTGLKTSGKSTAFGFIKEAYPEVVEIQLARKLKDESSRVFGIPRDAFDNPSLKEVPLEMPVFLDRARIEAMIRAFGFEPDYDKHVRPHVGVLLETPRRVAQFIGTEVLRNVDQDIHCRGAIMGIPDRGLFVITDMRFLSEFEFFSGTSGFYPFYIQSDRAEMGAIDMHPSEREVLKVAERCTRISNNGSLNDLKQRVLALVGEVTQ